MKIQQILGTILLISGLVVIVLCAFSVYKVFTGAVEPPQVIEMKGITLAISSEGMAAPGSVELLSQEATNKITNMGVWYILMFFITSAASRVCGMGIQLLKEIRVITPSENAQGIRS